MNVSRLNVPTDAISLQSGFFQFDPARYLDLLGLTPIPSQIAVINALDRYRFVTAALSRRQGKTYIANVIGQLISLFPGTNILFMAPNYALSQISFDLQRQLIKHFALEVDRDNAKDKVIELSNGSTIRFGSVNQVDSVLGRSYDLIVFDECAIVDAMDAFNIVLRPTLDKPGSRALFISTPRGRNNWFSILWERGFGKEFPEWCSIKATWKDNPRADLADIEEARASMSAAEFAQEYEADFSTFEGRIWNFDHEKCVEDLSSFEGNFDTVLCGVDPGFKDPTAIVVVGEKNGTYYVLDEYLDNGRSTAEHAAALQGLIDKWGIEMIFIDSAAAQTSYDLAYLYDIPTIKAKKSVLDGISFTSAIVEQDKLIVHHECKEVLGMLDQYQWDPREGLIVEKPKHDRYSHMADALRYALYTYGPVITD
jgi:phage terminase large subunit